MSDDQSENMPEIKKASDVALGTPANENPTPTPPSPPSLSDYEELVDNYGG